MTKGGNPPARQRGWAGVITLLFAVLIVAVVAGILMRQQGLQPAPASRAAPGAEGASNAMERARALEQTVQKQAADLDKRIDEGAK